MKIGVVYPQIELGGDPAAVRRIGKAVEDLWFDYLLAYDHVLGAVHAYRTPPLPGPYTELDPFHDPFVMFRYLAGITERIGFATGYSYCRSAKPHSWHGRLPMSICSRASRLRLGVGVGWNHVEYEALGQDFRTRAHARKSRSNLLRRLFTEPIVDYTARFYRVDRAALVPKPARGPSRSGSAVLARRLSIGGPPCRRIHLLWCRGRRGGCGCLEVVAWTHVKLGRSDENFGGEYVALSQGIDK